MLKMGVSVFKHKSLNPSNSRSDEFPHPDVPRKTVKARKA